MAASELTGSLVNGGGGGKSASIFSMYISRIRLENIRGFRELDLDLRGPDGKPRQRTLIIGKNGTGKTTVLRAIVLGLCDRPDADALLAAPIGDFLSEDAEIGMVQIFYDPWITKTKFVYESGRDKVASQESGLPVAVFVCGYGAGRYGVGPEPGREYRILDSVYTLFDYRGTLLDPELILRRLRDSLGRSRYEAILERIKTAMGLSPEDKIRPSKGGGIELYGPSIGGRIRLEGWADGYRLTLCWLLDVYGWAMRADYIDQDGNVRGILLIDEIEQHLHPSMQAEILPWISEAFPEMQIFATTHSPLVALDAQPEELVVLRREGDQVVAETSVPDFTGYSAEDMLADERLFDTEVYAPETQEKVVRYRSLAAVPRRERTAAETLELRDLALSIEAQPRPESRESDMVRELKRLIDKHNL
jgi:putative AbiEii toxin of type IV toxin-antitoxin system/AAA domain-containing protein